MNKVRIGGKNIDSKSSERNILNRSEESHNTQMSRSLGVSDKSKSKGQKSVLDTKGNKLDSGTTKTAISEYQDDMLRLQNSLPWVEKYRPKKIENVSLDRNIKQQIKKMIEDRDIRNIILEGPSGVGKTSTVRCIAREIFGKYYSRKVLEINASDDRGIKIQNPIDIFHRAYVHIDKEDHGKIPNFKLVILDEADNMTDKAKHNITKFIETNKEGVRFAFTCNSKDNISTAIQSRCHIINYPKLEKSFVIKRLKEICVAEGIILDDMNDHEIMEIDSGIFAISEIADGDLRIAVNTLQLTYDRYKTIDSEKVYGTYDKPHPEQSRDIIWACIEQDLIKSNMLITSMIKKGFSVTDVTAGLNLALRQSICQNIPNAIKIALIEKISYSQYNVSQGLELSHIQARGCIADMCEAIKNIDKQIIESACENIRIERQKLEKNGGADKNILNQSSKNNTDMSAKASKSVKSNPNRKIKAVTVTNKNVKTKV